MSEIRLETKQSQKLSQGMQTAIHLLSLDLAGMSDYMLKAVAENPALEYVPARKSAQDYAVRLKTRFRSSGHSSDPMATLASPVTVLEDLEHQLRCSGLDEEICLTAVQMLRQLTSRGYFTQGIDEFATENGIPPAAVRHALEAIQNLEPAGIGARSLEECLELQLRRRSNVDPLCYDLIRVHLMDISRGNLRQIVRETGATFQHVARCVEVIKSLNPTPCSLSDETVQYIMPEFEVENGADGQLTIMFYNDYYPTFRQDDNFRRLADTLSGGEKEYASKMLSSASLLIRAAETRQSTMEKLARLILREQKAFFMGEYNLVPLRVMDAANELGVHETTVYRALQGKYLYCRRGTYPLNHFFQQGVSGGVSKARVMEIIAGLIRENGKRSDREITELLEKQGIQLSRRTVAKYRSLMDIDSSFHRELKEEG